MRSIFGFRRGSFLVLMREKLKKKDLKKRWKVIVIVVEQHRDDNKVKLVE